MKGKEKNCILVRGENGKDKMSFSSVGRKGEENIEFFWNGRETIFCKEEWKKEEKLGKIVQNWAKNWKKKIRILEKFAFFLIFFSC